MVSLLSVHPSMSGINMLYADFAITDFLQTL